MCANCVHFDSTLVEGVYSLVEKNLRCQKHGFAVKKTYTCDEHETKRVDK